MRFGQPWLANLILHFMRTGSKESFYRRWRPARANERMHPGGAKVSKRKGVILVAAGLAAIATAATLYVEGFRGDAAHASPAPELLSAVPAGAPMLVYIDLAAIRSSSFYQHRPDHAPIAVPDADYANFIRATGFDFEKDLDRVVIAAWPQSLAPEQKKSVVLAEGRFDRQKIHDYAVKNGKLDRQQGQDVLLFPARDRSGWNSLVFLDNQRIAMVEGSSIAPVLATNNANSADPVRERAARVAGAAVFAISRVPAVPDNFAPGGIQSAQLAGLIRSVQWVTLAARPEGENIRVSLEGECQTDSDARQLESALQTLRMLGQAGLESPKTRQSMDPATFGVVETLLKTADITESAERVRILVEFTPDILKLSGSQKQK
jgi:hypothetical protein